MNIIELNTSNTFRTRRSDRDVAGAGHAKVIFEVTGYRGSQVADSGGDLAGGIQNAASLRKRKASC